ncbi:MAG: adenine phosphoribosyltransferase [Actinomycetota bacterium]|nr:adenine phosphoribosyltransferase [Actinomycetota bacterium]
MDLKVNIRDVPDFPKPGILFKDITPLLSNGLAFTHAIDTIAEHFAGQKIDVVLGAEARGFILGGALAYKLGCGFVPARKPGKLPHAVTQAIYDLEYGTDALEVHRDSIAPGQRVLIVDDVLATGGTAGAKAELVRKMAGEVAGLAFLIELKFLDGRAKLGDYDIYSLIAYD